MTDFRLLSRRADLGSLKRMRRNIALVHEDFGQSELVTLLDMLGCMRHGFGHLDYLTFGFAQNHGENRKTFMTMGDNIRLSKQLNDRSYSRLFLDKSEFNRAFQAFLGREYMVLTEGPERFLQFLQTHPVIFAKAPVSFGGQAVRRIDTSDAQTDPTRLYQDLLRNGLVLIEQPIVQHAQMQRLCNACVNTLRVVTIVDDHGDPHVVYTILRVGSGDRATDNVSSGGMYTMPNAHGEIVFPMFCDQSARYYTQHPKTGFSFSGFQIPFYAQALELCRQASLVETHIRYIGWDVAITQHGPVLIEGNPLPGYDMCQNYRFHADGKGMKKELLAAIRGDKTEPQELS